MGRTVSNNITATAVQLATLTANSVTMQKDISDIKDDIRDLKGAYVTKEEFTPVRNLVYGFVVLIVVAVVGALIALVVLKPSGVITQQQQLPVSNK